ncbi:MAG TPA: hypothetical protein PKM73_01390 [Verrucomicrobiota bacterium]|nr:hypothetical protein [Verrucomicrobiota bacterium]HNU50038.1 hypothetical protein [Verrucomicrobiota bacterium]
MARKVHGRVSSERKGADSDAALGDLKQVNAMLCEAVATLPKAVTFNEALACALSLVCRAWFRRAFGSAPTSA